MTPAGGDASCESAEVAGFHAVRIDGIEYEVDGTAMIGHLAVGDHRIGSLLRRRDGDRAGWRRD
jgi:hypothetical protein